MNLRRYPLALILVPILTLTACLSTLAVPANTQSDKSPDATDSKPLATQQVTSTSTPTETRTPAPTATLANTGTSTETATPGTTSTPTSVMRPTPAMDIGSTTLRQTDGMLMMYVPEGEFLMGSDPAKDNSAQFEEQPQHKVYLDAYWIDQTLVTNSMYGLCVNAGKCVSPQDDSSYLVPKYFGNSKFADYPVVHVDWNQAKTYCAWAGADLPTEAQWEKASRGTDGRLYPWGNNSPSCDLANFFGCSGDTTAVTSHKSGKSPYGVYDMAGNVREWVNDWYGYDYYSSSPERNPQGPASSDFRVLRGGPWYEADYGVRSANRYFLKPSGFSYDVGFRCARSPE
jgi:eukaryotic-like serine/threonine-protein kinase